MTLPQSPHFSQRGSGAIPYIMSLLLLPLHERRKHRELGGKRKGKAAVCQPTMSIDAMPSPKVPKFTCFRISVSSPSITALLLHLELPLVKAAGLLVKILPVSHQSSRKRGLYHSLDPMERGQEGCLRLSLRYFIPLPPRFLVMGVSSVAALNPCSSFSMKSWDFWSFHSFCACLWQCLQLPQAEAAPPAPAA